MCQIASESLAGDVDLGDLGAALFAEPALVALVAVAEGVSVAGVDGGFDECPAQVSRPGVAEVPAAVACS